MIDAASTEKTIFLRAIELTSAEERAAYLEAACDGDPSLRTQVEALLRAHERPLGLLDAPDGAAVALDQVPEEAGTVVGPYKLLELIGEGGMGLVYMAEQTEPVRRKVALKIIKPGMDTRQVIARFEAERQALAMMEHPNIARVLDAGATQSGRPYFVMELVRGVPITEYCVRHHLSINDRLDLFVLVCQAVQHAHQKGIIHRDIKPTNVLITLHDGVPVPKVIDFGIAKATGERLTDKTLFTGFAQLIGSPLYMSPEQAELSGIDIDTRSDIYSLGVLLYELLTGTTPFDRDTFRAAALDELRRMLREQDPPKPSTRLSSLDAASTGHRGDPRKLGRVLRGELDWIAMKALEKDRRRRYETAAAFASDVKRYLADKPVEAVPRSAAYHLHKFVRRHRAVLTTVVLVVSTLITGTTVSVWQTVLARKAREDALKAQAKANHQREVARRLGYVSDIRLAYQLVQGGQRLEAIRLLRRHEPAPDEADVRSFAWYYLMRLCHVERRTLRGHTGAVYHASFAADGRTVVTCGEDGTVRFWEVATGRHLKTIEAHQSEVNWTAFSPDGRTLATVGDAGTVKLWDTATNAEQASILAHAGDVIFVAFAFNGCCLLTAGRNDGMVRVWDRETQRMVAECRAADESLDGVAISPDGKTLATAGGDRYAKLWNLAELDKPPILLEHYDSPLGVGFSRDGRWLTTGGRDQIVRVWDLNTRKARGEFWGRGHTSEIQSVNFLPDGHAVISASDDGSLRLWDAVTGEWLGTLSGHTDRIWGVTVSPDGSTLASASSDGSVKIWETWPPRLEIALLPGQGVRWGALAFTADDRTLIAVETVAQQGPPDQRGGIPRGRVEFNGFDATMGTRRFFHSKEDLKNIWIRHTHLTSDGTYSASWSSDGNYTVWDVASGRPCSTGQGFPCVAPPAHAFHADSILTVRLDRLYELRDVARGQTQIVLRGSESLSPVEFSPKSNLLAATDAHQALSIWDLSENRIRASRKLETPGGKLTFSRDGHTLAAGSSTGSIYLFDARTLDQSGTLLGHNNQIARLAFSPDGKTLVSGTIDGTLKFWDVAAKEELFTLRRRFGQIVDIEFAHDGRTLAFWSEADSGLPHLHVLPTVPSTDHVDPDH